MDSRQLAALQAILGSDRVQGPVSSSGPAAPIEEILSRDTRPVGHENFVNGFPARHFGIRPEETASLAQGLGNIVSAPTTLRDYVLKNGFDTDIEHLSKYLPDTGVRYRWHGDRKNGIEPRDPREPLMDLLTDPTMIVPEVKALGKGASLAGRGLKAATKGMGGIAAEEAMNLAERGGLAPGVVRFGRRKTDSQATRELRTFLNDTTKIKDETGEAATLAHGTQNAFQEFDRSRFGSGAGGDMVGQGVYLSTPRHGQSEFMNTKSAKAVSNYAGEPTPLLPSEEELAELLKSQYPGGVPGTRIQSAIYDLDSQHPFDRWLSKIGASGVGYHKPDGTAYPLHVGSSPMAVGYWEHHEGAPSVLKADTVVVNPATGRPTFMQNVPLRYKGTEMSTPNVRLQHAISRKPFDITGDVHYPSGLLESIARGDETIQDLQKHFGPDAGVEFLAQHGNYHFPVSGGDFWEGMTNYLTPEEIRSALARKGYDSIRHQGGLIFDKAWTHDAHNVFDPENVIPAFPSDAQAETILNRLLNQDGKSPFKQRPTP